MDRLRSSRHWMPWAYLALILCSLFAIIILYARLNAQNDQIKNLVAQNRTRIIENTRLISAIQRSRVLSCRRTYAATYTIFAKLLPPSKRSPRQRRTFRKLRKVIFRLQHSCVKQTKPKAR